MSLRLNLAIIAALSLACTGGSSSDDTEGSGDTMAPLTASCDSDPAGVAVQYSCDSTATTGQCTDYVEGFDLATMDITCDAMKGVGAAGESCSVEDSIGRCCNLNNGQWFVHHYANIADAPLSADELKQICEDGAGVWYF